MAAAKAVKPSRSVSRLRSAEAMKGCGAAFNMLASADFFFALMLAPAPNDACRAPAATGVPRSALLLFPGGEGLGEGTVAGRTLFHREDGTAAVGIDDGHVEPGTVLEQFDVALHVGVDGG